MIELTRVDKDSTKFLLNVHNIIDIVSGGINVVTKQRGTSVILMVNDKKIIVAESKDEIKNKIKMWYREVFMIEGVE